MHSELSLIVQGQRLDVSREEEANWMKFIRPAESEADQNLLLNETNGQIYFTSTRNIVSEEELRVWYSEEYANSYSLSITPTKQEQSVNDNHETTKEPKKSIGKHKNLNYSAIKVF